MDPRGHVIMAAYPNILRGESSTVSVLAWNPRKIRRVVRSCLGAECAVFSTGLEHTDMFRVLCMKTAGAAASKTSEDERL